MLGEISDYEFLIVKEIIYILYRDDLTKLEYMYACIQESMRLFPAVPNISRCLERDLDLPDGRVIPKGNLFLECFLMLDCCC
jgi:cytochrome P450